MPNPSKGPRLAWQKARGKRKGCYVIRDGQLKRGTDCGEGQLAEAQRKLDEYKQRKAADVPIAAGASGLDTPVTAVLTAYFKDRTAPEAAKRIVNHKDLSSRLDNLMAFFGTRPLKDVTPKLVQAYTASRGVLQGARRELTDFRAAIGHMIKNGDLDVDIRPRIGGSLPPPSVPRNDWFTQEEIVMLLHAAWRYRRPRHGKPTSKANRQHLARFILIALYTGTRCTAICEAAIRPTIGRGYVDLRTGVFYRKAREKAETIKGQPDVILPLALLDHIRRWERRGISLNRVIEYEGEGIKSCAKAFKRLCGELFPGRRLSPHTLRHTAISWALQNGQTTWEASAYFGVSEPVIRKTYAHSNEQVHRKVGAALTGRPQFKLEARRQRLGSGTGARLAPG